MGEDMFYGEDDMKMKFYLDLYEMLSKDMEKQQEALLGVRIYLRTIESLNVSAFEDVDFLTILQIDLSDIMIIIFNSPLQLNEKIGKKYHRISRLLTYELTDNIRRPKLIQIYLRKWISAVLERIDHHFRIIGYMMLEVGTAGKLTSSMISRMYRDIKGEIKEEIKENFMDNE